MEKVCARLTSSRRAKIKNIAKRSIESGEDCDGIPESMRNYLAMQAYGPHKGMAPGVFARGPGFMPYGNGNFALNPDASAAKTVIQHFHCRSLAIGTWRRVGQNSMDLVIFYSPERACITYYIHNEASGYKIEFPFAWIKNITLEQGDVLSPAEGASQGSGGLVVELTRPPKFYMDSPNSDGFYECGDFTEDRQASKVMIHHLGGPSKVLSGQLAKLRTLEAWLNRHHLDPNSFAISAPVSPVGHRPASQPNHMLHPHHQMGMFPPPDPNMGMMGPPGPRGHKRQRSRSVPVAVDFSMLRQPMPSFLIQHEGHPAPHVQDPNIFAPQPQHQPHPAAFGGPIPGQNLSLDTTSGFPMDFGRQFNGPMSATTLNSPSEFGTPGFFAATAGENVQAPQFTTPFANGFLAVDPSAMLGTSNTPLSVTSHADPVIADHSPPLTGLGRSQSADVFGTPGENAHFGDDGAFLSDSFNKQMNLPFRGPMSDEHFQTPMPEGPFSFDVPSTSSDGQMSFQSPPTHPHDAAMSFQSPPQPNQSMHQDSGIAFSTPSQLSHEHPDGNILYNDAKFQSPAQLQAVPDEQNTFHPSPMYHQSTPATEFDMPSFIDPNSLGHSQQH